MPDPTDSPAELLLAAVDLATEANVHSLAALAAAHPDLFRLELVLRILLTYLPESTQPSLYIDFLQKLVSGNLSSLDEAGYDEPLHSKHDRPKSRTLPLLPLPSLQEHGIPDTDLLTRFLVAKAHRIDSETGSLTDALQLIEPFVGRSEYLRIWVASILLPLLRIDYEHYPDTAEKFTLSIFEGLKGRAGLYTLLFDLLRRNKNSQSREYARDFRTVLGPWVNGETWRTTRAAGASKLVDTIPDPDGKNEEDEPATIWDDVFEALLDHAVESPASIVELAQSWGGPEDVDHGDWSIETSSAVIERANKSYAQMMLAALYLPPEAGLTFSREQQGVLLRKGASLANADLKYNPFKPDLSSSAELVSYDLLSSVLSIQLARGELLDRANPLTTPNVASVHLAALLIASTSLLEGLGESISLPAVASLSLFGDSHDQKKRAQKVLNALAARSSAGDGFWREVRQKMLWLHRWNMQDADSIPRHGIFCRVERQELETEILKTLLSAGRTSP